MAIILILIPPSEGKQKGGSYTPINLNELQECMLEKLEHYTGDHSHLLGVKEKALEQAILANNTIRTSLTLPAIKRYTGVVYQGINYDDMSESAKKYCNKHVRIMSALFGLIEPLTLIPNYKFKIGTLGATKFWGENNNIDKKYFVIDLLPKSHKKAVTYDTGIQIDFYRKRFGAIAPAGHEGKLVKGKFVRWLCEQQCFNKHQLKDFKEDGYRWTGKYFLKEDF